MSGASQRFRWSPYRFENARAISEQLELSPATAAILCRRGYDTVEGARRFLEAADAHDPFCFAGMADVCAVIGDHIARGSAICVYGDYDVDGVCATALLVRTLRRLGCDCSWRLPSRQAGGYGLSIETVGELAASGTDLLIAADCAITATREVAEARRCGMEVIVCDHHLPGPQLPECRILHPTVSGYPFAELCATGVCGKLAEALFRTCEGDPTWSSENLDLVCLATVCDAVSLTGENRRLVRTGLRSVAQSHKPGLQALIEVARLDRFSLDSHAVAFGLGPRINAAGRLADPDAALELLLTEDPERARQVAEELELLNRERQAVESRILIAAEAARAEQPDAYAYVLSGEGWHPGVLGIVASRMVDRHGRPCAVIGSDNGLARGSARSIPGYHLREALEACSDHLSRFGGHSAACGFELATEKVADFRSALHAHASATLAERDLTPTASIDAVIGADGLGLDLAEELTALEPYGIDNPTPRLLIPACTLSDLAPMGSEGQHARFSVANGGSRARAVAFRRGPDSLAKAQRSLHDICVRLELNEFNQMVEPRLVLEALAETRAADCKVLCEREPFFQTLERELSRDPSVWFDEPAAFWREVCDRRGRGFAGVCGDLVSTAEPTLVICADAQRRREGLSQILGGLGAEREGLAIASWDELAADMALAEPFVHLIALDPPPLRAGVELLQAAPCDRGQGFCHLAWGPAETEFALAAYSAKLELRSALSDFYRALRGAQTLTGPELRTALMGPGRFDRSPIDAARVLRVLQELGLCLYSHESATRPATCEVAADEIKTTLERSAGYRAYQSLLADATRYLTAAATPSRQPLQS